MLDRVQETRLPNGVRVVSSSLDHVESVSLGVWVGVGARDESNKMAGASHFIEHLLFKGTETRNARQISQSVEGRGGHLNAFTQEESTCYYARVPFDQACNTLKVLADMYLNSRFDPVEIEREKGVVLEEIRMYHDQPQHLVHEQLGACVWPSHPLGRPIAGAEKALMAMDRESLTGFVERYYIPSRTVISFAGKVDHEKCVEWVASLLGGMPVRRMPARRKVPQGLKQLPVCVGRSDIEQVHVALGLRCSFGRGDKRRYALRVLSAMLGENMSSRLFQVVRERHGLAYSVHSSVQLYADTGALVISAGLDRNRATEAVQLITREMVRLRDGRISRAELKRTRDYLVGYTRLSLESTSSQMNWLGESVLSYGRPVHPTEAIDNVLAVELDDVREVASALISPAVTSLSAVVPEKDVFDEKLSLSMIQRLK